MPEVIQQTIKNEHVLGAALMFQHPTSGYRYYGVCEKRGGSDQDFVVYRRAEGARDFEFVYALDGAGRDATAFVTQGGAIITRDGALEVWASGQGVGVNDTSGTGFSAIGAIVPGVDDPWTFPKATKAVQTPAHIKLNPPAGYKPYGANQSWVLSAEVVDGLPVFFIAQEGWGYSPGNKGFGEYVFKQVGDRRAEYVRYNGLEVMDGRGDLYVFGNGQLYISGNESDDDKLPSAYLVPGFVPFGNGVFIGGSSTGGGSDPALAQRVSSLEKQLADAITLANKAMERANYVKTVFDPVWSRLDALDRRPVGISRDDAWALAPQAVYADLENAQGGIAGRILALVANRLGGGIDQPARDIANAALERAAQAKQLAEQGYTEVSRVNQRAAAIENSRPTVDEVAQLFRKYLDAQWTAWVTYADPRMLNLLWDRAVKLLRFKEKNNRTAEQLPVNDQNNLKV